MKQVKALQLGLALGALALGGAGVRAAYTGPKVELTYVSGYLGSDRPAMESLVKQFNDTHPNIVVKIQGQPWDTTMQQMGPLVAAGRAPDVVVALEHLMTNFTSRGALSELTAAELTSAGITSSSFYPNLWKAGVADGKVYGVPMGLNTMVLYYNKDAMAKYGVTKVPTTYDELVAAGRRCTTDKAGRGPADAAFDASSIATYGFGVPAQWWSGTIAYAALRSLGGDVADAQRNPSFNSAAGQRAVQLVKDLVDKHRISPANLTHESDLAAFREGRSCFNVTGGWTVPLYKETKGLNFGVAWFPRFGTRYEVWGNSAHLVLPKQPASYDRNKRAAAVEFLGWMTQAKQNLAWTTSGALPSRPDVARSKEYAGSPVAASVVPRLSNVNVLTGYPWIGAITDGWWAAVEAALLGKKDVKQALDDGVREASEKAAQIRQSR